MAISLSSAAAFFRRQPKQVKCECGDTTVDRCRCARVEDASRTLDRVEQATAGPGELRQLSSDEVLRKIRANRPTRARCRCGNDGYCE